MTTTAAMMMVVAVAFVVTVGVLETGFAQPPAENGNGNGVADGAASIEPGEHAGRLDETDMRYDSGEYFDTFRIHGKAGQTLRLRLESGAFDPYLILRSPSGDVTANDDAAPTDLAAAIVTILPETGIYTIECTSADADATGDYRLFVAISGEENPTLAARPVTDIQPGTHHGELTPNGPIRFDGCPVALYAFAGEKGQFLRLRMRADAFDPVLLLYTPDGARLKNTAGTEKSTAAAFEFELVETGRYTLVCSAATASGFGAYTLDFAFGGTVRGIESLVSDQPVQVGFDGDFAPRQYSIAVPADAKSLEIKLVGGEIDVDIWVREAHPFYGWSYISDLSSTALYGHESVFLAGNALRRGTTYYVLVTFADPAEIPTVVTLTATIDAPRPGSYAQEKLAPGAPVEFMLPADGYFHRVFALTVPPHAESLFVYVDTRQAVVFLRHGQPALTAAQADWFAVTGETREALTVLTGRHLKAGPYFLTVQTSHQTMGSVQIGIDTAPPKLHAAAMISPDRPVTLAFPRPGSPGGLAGDGYLLAVEVPEGAMSMAVMAEADVATVGRMILSANHWVLPTPGNTAVETLSVQPSAAFWLGPDSSPPLRPGIYYLRVAARGVTDGPDADETAMSVRVAVEFDIPNPAAVVPLRPDEPIQRRLPWLGQSEIKAVIDVPPSTTAIDIRATITAGNATHTHLLVSRGEVLPELGNAEWRSFATATHAIAVVRETPGEAERLSVRFAATGAVAVTLSVVLHDTPKVVREAEGMLTAEAPALMLDFPRADGEHEYRLAFAVPDGAQSVKIAVTGAQGNDYDLFAHFGEPASSATAEHRASTMERNEILWIGQTSEPALRPGLYGLTVRAFGRRSETIAVTLTFDAPSPTDDGNDNSERPDGPRPADPAAPVDPEAFAKLVPGEPMPLVFEGETVVRRLQFRFVVPAEAQSVRLAVAGALADCDLHVRHGERPVMLGESSDHEGTSAEFDEILWIGRESDPPLRSGNYFVEVRAYGQPGNAAQLTLTFDAPRPPAPSRRPGGIDPESLPRLRADVPIELAFPTASGEHSAQLRFEVPENARSVRIAVSGATADVDLFARHDRPLQWSGEAEHEATTVEPNEILVITRADTPPLRSGRYFLLVRHFGSEPMTITVTLTIETTPPTGNGDGNGNGDDGGR